MGFRNKLLHTFFSIKALFRPRFMFNSLIQKTFLKFLNFCFWALLNTCLSYLVGSYVQSESKANMPLQSSITTMYTLKMLSFRVFVRTEVCRTEGSRNLVEKIESFKRHMPLKLVKSVFLLQ